MTDHSLTLSNDRSLNVNKAMNGKIMLTLEGPQGGLHEPARLSRQEAAELISVLANMLAAE